MSCLKCQKYKADQIVFKKGTEGEDFYIIIEGNVSVEVPNKAKFEKIQRLKDEITKL